VGPAEENEPEAKRKKAVYRCALCGLNHTIKGHEKAMQEAFAAAAARFVFSSLTHILPLKPFENNLIPPLQDDPTPPTFRAEHPEAGAGCGRCYPPPSSAACKAVSRRVHEQPWPHLLLPPGNGVGSHQDASLRQRGVCMGNRYIYWCGTLPPARACPHPSHCYRPHPSRAYTR